MRLWFMLLCSGFQQNMEYWSIYTEKLMLVWQNAQKERRCFVLTFAQRPCLVAFQNLRSTQEPSIHCSISSFRLGGVATHAWPTLPRVPVRRISGSRINSAGVRLHGTRFSLTFLFHNPQYSGENFTKTNAPKQAIIYSEAGTQRESMLCANRPTESRSPEDGEGNWRDAENL